MTDYEKYNRIDFDFGVRGNLTQKCAQNCIVVGNIQENPELLE